MTMYLLHLPHSMVEGHTQESEDGILILGCLQIRREGSKKKKKKIKGKST